MARMQFGITAFERARGDLPELPVINMFVEEAPTEETGVVLQSRPGLEETAVLGSGPIGTLFRKDGVLGGAQFAVSGGMLYSGTTSVGAVVGSGPWSIDGFEDQIFIAGGGPLYTYDGVTLVPVSFPDGANVTKVVVGASRAICLRADTETYYFSDPLSETIGALSFISAESQPDRLRDILFIDDIAILFGAETVEFHPNTGDPNLPYQPLEGRVFEAGVQATGCAAAFGSTFAWITDNNRICLSDPDNVISNAGLEAKIEASTAVSLWAFWLEGTEFLALRLDTQTYVFTDRAKTWHEFSSWDETNWLPCCFAGGVFGSGVSGSLMAWTGAHSDLGGVLERRFRFGAPLNSGSASVNNIQLRTDPGNTPFLTGTYADPVVELRLSRNTGKTWGNWKQAKLGAQGDYRKRVRWIGLGMAGYPGLFGEVRLTDPVPLRVSEVLLNEPWGGV